MAGSGKGRSKRGLEGSHTLLSELANLAMSVGSAVGGAAASLFGGTTSLALDTTAGIFKVGQGRTGAHRINLVKGFAKWGCCYLCLDWSRSCGIGLFWFGLES